MSDSRIVVAFHERWWQDLAEGRRRSLAEYLALWPGHEAALAREYLALAEEDDDRTAIDGSPAAPARAGPSRLGPFRLMEELGRGGQGVVYKAHDERLGRTVALKVLHATADPSGAAFLRFQREATVASRLEHPGICAVLEAGREGATAWIAMRFVEGESLSRRIAIRRECAFGDRTRTLPEPAGVSGSSPASGPGDRSPAAAPARTGAAAAPSPAVSTSSRDEIHDVARLVAAAARAVHAAHEAGVVHRDLKPGNLMVSRAPGSDAEPPAPAGHDPVPPVVRSGEVPVVLDFGLARDDSAPGAAVTATGEIFGTPAYMAPEQLRPDGPPPDRRADVWALGVTLYEALALRRPFEGATHEILVRSILGREPVPVRRLVPRLPRDLAVVVATAIEKDLARRYQTAAALADDLEAAVEHRPIRARPVGPAGRALRWARREPARAAVVLLLALGIPTVAGLGAYVASTRDAVRTAEAAEARREIERLLEQGFLDADAPDTRPPLRCFAEVLRRDPGNPEALLGRCMTLKLAGRPREALDALGGPDIQGTLPPALRRVRAGLLRQLGRNTDADAEAAGLAAPESADDLFVAGLARLADVPRDGRTAAEEALKHLSASILRSPAARPLHYFMAASAAAKARDATAGEQLVAAIRALWGSSSRARLACAFVKQLRHQDAEATQEYEEALRLDPGSHNARLGLADIQLRNGRFAPALALYRDALARSPGNAASAGGVAECLIRLGCPDEARKVIDDALRTSPGDSSLIHTLGHLLAQTGDHEQAIAHYRRALGIRPVFSASHLNLANSLMKLGRPEEAETEYRLSLAQDPDQVPAHLGLALLLGQRGDNAGARDEFLAADDLQPGDPEILYNLGLARYFCNEHEPAAADLRRVVALKPEDRLARLALARALDASGDADAALASAREAMAAGHASSGLCYLAGGWLTRAGRIEEAAEAYRESARIDPENAEAWCNLGQRLKVLGRFEEALAAARKGHEIGSARPDWDYPSEIWVNACAELVEADAGLRAALDGTAPAPPSAHAWLRMAEVSGIRKRAADEARCLEEAWKADPALAADAGEAIRFRAAEAALRAARDGPADDAAAWRARAREWMQAELDRLEAAFDAGRISEETLSGILRSWVASDDLGGVRDGPALDALPADEARAWMEFWTRVAALRARADV